MDFTFFGSLLYSCGGGVQPGHGALGMYGFPKMRSFWRALTTSTVSTPPASTGFGPHAKLTALSVEPSHGRVNLILQVPLYFIRDSL
jgi:hypothetical protein